MDYNEAAAIYQRYKEGIATPADRALLEQAYLRLARTQDLPPFDKEEVKASIWSRVSPRKTRRLSPYLPYAAAVLIFALVGTYYFFGNQILNRHSKIENLQSADIDPGGNRATLTLADGRKIVLDEAANGELAEESGIKITKTEDGQIVYEVTDARITDARQPEAGSAGWRASAMRDPATYNTIETPKGGQYKIILPDSSVVWLNAASSLRYPTRFSGEERRVELTGEAYFQISSKYQVEEKRRSRDIGDASIKTASAQAVGDTNKSKIVNLKSKIPFVVATATQEVEVLGTQFNINAYKDELAVKTTLVEGSVRVQSLSPSGEPVPSLREGRDGQGDGRGRNEIILVPNEQSILSATAFTKQQVDVEYVIAWKDGIFRFNEESLESIMRKISRWYNIAVEFREPSVKSDPFTGVVTRHGKASQVIKMLERAGDARFEIQDNLIIVTKK